VAAAPFLTDRYHRTRYVRTLQGAVRLRLAGYFAAVAGPHAVRCLGPVSTWFQSMGMMPVLSILEPPPHLRPLNTTILPKCAFIVVVTRPEIRTSAPCEGQIVCVEVLGGAVGRPARPRSICF